MVKLLISPVTLDEAKEAIAGGVDIIDIKNPQEGSLGANFPWKIREIRASIPMNIELSATLGDLPYLPGTCSLAALGLATCDVSYVKAGLKGPKSIDEAVDLMSSIRRSVKDYNSDTKIVAACYADFDRANTLSPLELSNIGCKSEIDVVMVDTLIKDGKNLFDFMTIEQVNKLVEEAHENGLLVALAGALRKNHLKIIKDTKCDIIGIRTAACEPKDRVNGKIKKERVQEMINLLNS